MAAFFAPRALRSWILCRTPTAGALLAAATLAAALLLVLPCSEAHAQSVELATAQPIDYGKHVAGTGLGQVDYNPRHNATLTLSPSSSGSHSIVISTSPAPLVNQETGVSIPQSNSGIHATVAEQCSGSTQDTYPLGTQEATVEVGTCSPTDNASIEVSFSGSVDIPATASPGLYVGCVYVQAHVLSF